MTANVVLIAVAAAVIYIAIGTFHFCLEHASQIVIGSYTCDARGHVFELLMAMVGVAWITRSK